MSHQSSQTLNLFHDNIINECLSSDWIFAFKSLCPWFTGVQARAAKWSESKHEQLKKKSKR